MKKTSRKYIALIAAVIFAAVAVWVIWTNINIMTSHITIENDKIPSEFKDFKIAQVSDLHNRKWGDKLIKRLESESPDIIVVTGDLVDSSHTDLDAAMEFIDRALKLAPVYYVTGNHEAWLDAYGVLKDMLTASGVHMMDDRSEWIEKEGARINLAGVQDPDLVERASFEGIQEAIVASELEPLLSKEYYNVVLCHRPELFDVYVKSGAELVITGHAHGGQVRLPFIGGLVAPDQGLFPKYTEGVYNRGDTDMVVSRGLGNSVIPVRVNNMPELVIITLDPD